MMRPRTPSPPPLLPILPSALRERQRVDEWMDDPALPKVMHAEALRGLERINALSFSARILLPPLRQLEKRLARPLVLVDAGSGGGDVAARLLPKLLPATQYHGLDASPLAVKLAKERNIPGARFHVADLFAPWPQAVPAQPDVILCSLFLHHFDEESVVTLLRDWRRRRPHLLLISDLRRKWLDWWMIWLGARVLSRSPVVHRDSALSVQGAFTAEEFRSLFAKARMPRIRIENAFPCRQRILWRGRNP